MKTLIYKRQKGLTLIELLLVLVIIIALAGLMVPVFANVVGQSHAASGAGNIEAVVRQIENHKAMYGTYPDDLDLLLDDSGGAGVLVPFGGTVAATELTTAVPSDRTVDALIDGGITTVIRHPATPADEQSQTTLPTDGSTEVTIDDTPTPAEVVVLGAEAIERLGLETAGVEAYVVLGLGNNNNGVGTSMAAAPTHFLPDGGSIQDIYSRFLLVFRVPDEEGGVRLATVATVDVHDGAGEVVGIDTHIHEYHHARE